MSAHLSTTALWYLSRATGLVAFVLLSLVVVLGVLVNRQARVPGLPRFGVLRLHRNISLLGVMLIAVHVVTAVADPYVTIGWVATVLPFTSPYKPVAIGLGALALDLLAAVVVTSLLRQRIGRRTWRAVHWLAYAMWPVAAAHGVTSATDLRSGVLLDVTLGCIAGVVAAVGSGAAAALATTPREERARTLITELRRGRWAS